MTKKTKLKAKIKMTTQFAGLSLAGLLSIAFCTTSATSQEVSVTSERPVQAAVEQLEDLYRVPITYEDTLYMNEDDFADVTAEVRLDHDGSNPHRVLVPARRTITFPAEAEIGRVKSQSERSAGALMALKNVIDSYALAAGAGEFSVFQDSAGLHVVSRTFRDVSARLETMSPVLEMPVWITKQHRPALDVIEEICRQVSLRGRLPLDVGTVPTNLLANTPVSIDAANAKARDVLESVSEQVGVPLSWHLLCDPRAGCALNIHVPTQ
jgi:hypothetical protein